MYKEFTFSENPGHLKTAENFLIREYNESKPNDDEDIIDIESLQPQQKILSFIPSFNNNSRNDELKTYLMEAQEKIDVAEYWRSKKEKGLYPILTKIAQKYISVPATSVPSEQLFSHVGEIITDRRNRLAPDFVTKLVFLSKNKWGST